MENIDVNAITQDNVVAIFLNMSYIMMMIIIIYFENVHFFHDKKGLDVCPYLVPPHILEYRPFRM